MVAFENKAVVWKGRGLQKALMKDMQSDRVEMAVHANERKKSASRKQVEDVV